MLKINNLSLEVRFSNALAYRSRSTYMSESYTPESGVPYAQWLKRCYTVAKFGGSSLADAAQIKKVIDIVRADPSRRSIVVSAPGKGDLERYSDGRKITDLFEDWQQSVATRRCSKAVQSVIRARYRDIVAELGIQLDIRMELDEVAEQITAGAPRDYAVSRGEYLCAKIVALALGYNFVDVADCISFRDNRLPDGTSRYRRNDKKLRTAVHGRPVVIPGFYGRARDGSIRTFSRGGSDITGAIVARALNVNLYENWSDTPLRTADPRIVPKAKPIRKLTYPELRDFAYCGANVFHEDAMFPVQEAKIPTRIANTNDPADPGTIVISQNGESLGAIDVIGIAGRRGMSAFTIKKPGMKTPGMKTEVGTTKKALGIFERRGISIEHAPTGVDSIQIVTALAKEKSEQAKQISDDVKHRCLADSVSVRDGLALISLIGREMRMTPVLAKAFVALAGAGIETHMTPQAADNSNVTIGVKDSDYEQATRELHEAFCST